MTIEITELKRLKIHRSQTIVAPKIVKFTKKPLQIHHSCHSDHRCHLLLSGERFYSPILYEYIRRYALNSDEEWKKGFSDLISLMKVTKKSIDDFKKILKSFLIHAWFSYKTCSYVQVPKASYRYKTAYYVPVIKV